MGSGDRFLKRASYFLGIAVSIVTIIKWRDSAPTPVVPVPIVNVDPTPIEVHVDARPMASQLADEINTKKQHRYTEGVSEGVADVAKLARDLIEPLLSRDWRSFIHIDFHPTIVIQSPPVVAKVEAPKPPAESHDSALAAAAYEIASIPEPPKHESYPAPPPPAEVEPAPQIPVELFAVDQPQRYSVNYAPGPVRVAEKHTTVHYGLRGRKWTETTTIVHLVY